ncbi:vWA domain-containing protein [Paenibacillus spongiae]|uniref:VWA domain-containing protein n=1 Tax=Paenibacillus spongiae TaxID=2909671 RepID=A0ABY5SF29_9BACL|nr:BatA and WFA domain-containing protein [Paenibacillus spongiae]UVI32589.1 VWA domain-containing protein [Paenibacillus spongiae]
MFFQSLGSLWFALSLPAIALLYMLKRTYIDTPVSSHLLWNRALKEQEANRPWQKLRRSLLLLLQLACALLLVLALMEPGWWRSAAAEGHVVLVVDRSASMTGPAAGKNGEPSGGTKLEAAKSAVLQWLDEQKGDGTAVSIIATGGEPRIAALRERDSSKLKEAVRSLQPAFGENDGTAAVSLADALLREDKEGSVIVVTDRDWTDAASAEQLKLQSPVTLMDIADGGPAEGAAVAAFGVKRDPAKPKTHTAVVTLRNDGKKPALLQTDIYTDGNKSPVGTASVRVQPGEWESVTITDLPEASVYKAQLTKPDERYTADDALYRFTASSAQKHALLVTKGNLFLDKALQLAGISTVIADPASFEPGEKTAQSVDWIVLDGIQSEELQSKAWQDLLAAKPVWRFESAADGDRSRSTAPKNGTVQIADHPVTKYLSFEDIHISRLVQQSNITWGKAVVTYGGVPAVYAGQEGGKPMLLFTFDLHDSDLPLRPEFPVLVMQAADWMGGSAKSQLGEALSGSPKDIDFSPNTASASWMLVESAPGMARYADTMKPNQPEASGGVLASNQTVPDVPGLYRLKELDAQGEVVAERLLAVTADTREFASTGESRLLTLKQAAAADGSSTKQPPDGSPAASGMDVQSADSLIRWIALLLLAVIALEWGVYRRGRAI